MHSDVFPRADLAAILRAIALTAAMGNQSPAFQRGFAAALAAVATAVHVTPAELHGGHQSALAQRRVASREGGVD